MKSPLIPIKILSIYKSKLGDLLPLGSRAAQCTPDTYTAIENISKGLEAAGGKLILSDMFRTYDMQLQSHNDYISGKKKPFSPAPGGSFHEAGRAFDLDLSAIKIPLADFWVIADKFGMLPIIKAPKANALEAWHFDCRGSHQIVYQYYTDKMGNNFLPYAAAAASAILSVGIQVDAFGHNQIQAATQSCLIRLGKVIGNIDGQLGARSQKALEELNITFDTTNPASMLQQAENLIQQKFPAEFVTPAL